GTENYYSQNSRASGSLTTGPAASYFNSSDVDGYQQIIDSNSGLVVTVDSASTVNGAAILTDVANTMGNGSNNDEWKFVPTDTGFYKIINKNSGLAMVVAVAATTNGTPAVQFAYEGGTTYHHQRVVQPARH